MNKPEVQQAHAEPTEGELEKDVAMNLSVAHPDISNETQVYIEKNEECIDNSTTSSDALCSEVKDHSNVAGAQGTVLNYEADRQNQKDSKEDSPVVVERNMGECSASHSNVLEDDSKENKTVLQETPSDSQSTSVDNCENKTVLQENPSDSESTSVDNSENPLLENSNSKNPESFSMFKTDTHSTSTLETDLVTDALQNTVNEISKDIAQTVVDESKPSRNIESIASTLDENAMDVPTPCTSMPGTPGPVTPNNKALLRVASEADIGSAIGEDSNMSFVSETSRDEETNDTTSQVTTPKGVKKKAPKRRGDLSMLALNGSDMHDFGADKLYEYKWPQDGKGDWYMLQEQVSDFLGVLSFKRKYPDLERRAIEPNERVYLREKGLVTEMQCDLGLTALRSDLVHDLMARDYPDKYKEFLIVLKEKRKKYRLRL